MKGYLFSLTAAALLSALVLALVPEGSVRPVSYTHLTLPTS